MLSTKKEAALLAEPFVIVGAARSGTNMLRDVLCSLSGCGTWPCDEINYIWRHGNKRHPDDELCPEHATAPVRKYIRARFDGIAARRGLRSVVEKTCANSLRVPFVERILPEARFVHLVRDGRDVASSAVLRWTARLDLPYVLRKTYYVPLEDVPYYAGRYLWSRIHRVLSSEDRLSTWGPQFSGMHEALRQHPLPVVCALQWQRSVELATKALERLDPDRVVSLRYEDFVAAPIEGLEILVERLGIDTSSDEIARAVVHVSPDSVGRWQVALEANVGERITTLIAETLRDHRYE